MDSLRRVVVTGLGLVTPLATGVQKSWQELINGNCGIISLVSHEGTENTKTLAYGGFEGLPSTVAGIVKRGKAKEGGFDPEEWLDRGDERKMALFTQFAIASAKQALADAEWSADTDYEKERTGVCIGSGVGGFEDVVSSTLIYENQGYRKISPLFVPRMLINMAAGHLTMKYGFRGPNHAVATACTTGAHAIGDASRFIQFGDADVIIAGGSESCIHPLSLAGAKSLMTKLNDRPRESSRPFDRERDGFVISEGAGVVVLEELEHAKKRGARIYAEICGYGLSGDAYRMTAPPEDGSGAVLAMKRALHHSRSGNEIDYVNAHATSTILGDIAENRAIASVFPNRVIDKVNMSNVLAVSSNKGAIGHLLGAAGAVEAIFTILAVYENIIPPTLNLQNPDTEFRQFNYVPLAAQQKVVRAALTNSFGFGGVNASLCFRKFER
ncbi:5558_t:CDS:2 [Ambispora leptoticha]|uniref:3-oxoacyl-[acyl-carrier-protein] synthase n=1 Tax=Ambispora leptoticha TaxID=144679 RepID=A0A9N8ZD92_9GLOM|nr:5558_t:CDS:2 [Ambispora leptoticha]